MQSSNPLLNDNRGPIDYASVTLEHMTAAYDVVFEAYEHGIAAIIANQQDKPSWYGLVVAVDTLIADVIGVVNATFPLMVNGDDWSTAFEEAFARMQRLLKGKRRNRSLYALYERLAKNDPTLDVYERATLRKMLLECRLAGVHLDDEQRSQLLQLEEELATHRNAFFATLDKTIAESNIVVTDQDRLEGIPQRWRDVMAQQASEAGHDGWMIRCDEQYYDIVLEFAKDRELRKAVYKAYQTRGSHEDPKQDNSYHLQRLAELRAQVGQLLGKSTYAQLILQAKAASKVEPVMDLLQMIAQKIRPRMLKARSEILRLAEEHGLDQAQPWDIQYLRARKQTMNSEVLCEYFVLDSVVHAWTRLAEQLFGITFEPLSSKWHESVRCFSVQRDSMEIGILYLDVLQYPGKQTGAGTVTVRTRRRDTEDRVHPASVIVFSDTLPGHGSAPPLLDHLAQRKLFHEFGHALHALLIRPTNHVLSDPNRAGADQQEFFGELFERWLWNAEFLMGMSAHYQTGEALTREQVESALADLREAQLDKCAYGLSLALFDLELHTTPGDGKSPQQRVEECLERCGCWPLAGFEKPAHALDHLLTGYEGGYYSYIWGEVHAIDVFSYFERWGWTDGKSGERLRVAFLDWANARSMAESVQDFLDRPIQVEAFLQWYGLD